MSIDHFAAVSSTAPAVVSHSGHDSSSTPGPSSHAPAGRSSALRAAPVAPVAPVASPSPSLAARSREEVAQERLALLGAGEPLRLWGRLSRLRVSSGAVFADVVADGALWQIAALRQRHPESFALLSECVCGDLIEARGAWESTRSGDRALFCEAVARHAACEGSFPSWMEPASDETAAERPEMAMAADPRRQRWIQGRFRMVRGLRQWADAAGLWETPTPILTPCASGAAATPFMSRWQAGERELALRVAPENALIRLAMAGMEALYEMGPAFRNEGLSRRHHPEFWIMEAYRVGWSGQDALAQCVAAMNAGCLASGGRAPGAFAPLRVEEALVACGWSEEQARDLDWMRAQLRAAGHAPDTADSVLPWQALDELCELPPDPIALVGQPVALSPLAAREAADSVGSAASEACDRFELFLGGMEIANGYAQLRDRAEQADRFIQQAERAGAGAEALAPDAAYLRAMTLGMPAVAGFGVGVDRLAQWSLQAPSIRHVLPFPLRGA